MCYKICKDVYPCKGWTYDLNDHSCSLYNYENSLKEWQLSDFGYSSMGYNTDTNAKISGPRNCPGLWEKKDKYE